MDEQHSSYCNVWKGNTIGPDLTRLCTCGTIPFADRHRYLLTTADRVFLRVQGIQPDPESEDDGA